MKTTADFLDDLRARLELPSDNKLALAMGWERQQVSRYRTRRHTFDDRTAVKVAAALGVEPDHVLACMAAQRAVPESRAAWARIAAKVAAAIALVVGLAAFDISLLDGQSARAAGAGPYYTYAPIRRRRQDRGAKGWKQAFLALARLATALALAGALAACSGLQVRIEEQDAATLASTCSDGRRTGAEPDLNGCYRMSPGVCMIYTLPAWVRESRDGSTDGYFQTLGHELHHCTAGNFHGEAKGVQLPVLPALALRIGR